MERVQVLIDKLVQQKRAGETAAQLLYTVQLLQTELLQLQQQKEVFSSRKVAVVMPANYAAPQPATGATTPAEIDQKEKQTFLPVEKTAPPAPAQQPSASVPPQPAPAPEPEKPKATLQQNNLFGNEAYTLKRPAVVQPEEAGEAAQPPVYKKEEATLPPLAAPQAEPQPFDAIAETPTLLQHLPPPVETPKEINEMISVQKPSLNDRLKEEKVELAHRLKDTPIKDLRKAIGINDRFVFVSELFRGDEAMYERSIKTINSFHVFQEAEYWMNRELKVKLGWSDNKEAVQHFYGLVRRRFS